MISIDFILNIIKLLLIAFLLLCLNFCMINSLFIKFKTSNYPILNKSIIFSIELLIVTLFNITLVIIYVNF